MTIRRYKSSAPDDSLVLARFQHGEELWHLYVRRKVTDARFVNLKLAALDYVPHKASYWLGWHLKRGALHPQRNDDLRLARETRPALLEAVDKLMRELSEDGGDVRLIDVAEWPVVTIPCNPYATPLGGVGGTAQSTLPGETPTSPATPLFHRGAGRGSPEGQSDAGSAPDEDENTGETPTDINEVEI